MDLEPNEKKLGSWIINLLTTDARYNGKLVITDQYVYYDINYSFTGAGQDGHLKFSRADISQIETYTKFWIFQRLKITLKDGQTYIFDRGVMPISGIAKLLK